MSARKLSLFAFAVVTLLGVQVAPASAATAEQSDSVSKPALVIGSARSAPQAACGIKKFFTNVGKGISSGFKLVTGGIVKIFNRIKNLVTCVAKKGSMDIIKLFSTFLRSPFKFIKDTFTGGFKFIGDLVKGMVVQGGETLSAIVGSATGGKLSQKSLHAFGDWVWSQFENLATKLGAIGCLVQFARPLKEVLRSVIGWVAGKVLPLMGTLYRKFIEPRLAGWMAKGVDKVVQMLVGQEWKDRIKAIAARIFDPAARAKAAAKKFKTFLGALAAKKGDLRSRWLDVRALISTAPDFGVRNMMLVTTEAVKLLIEVVIDKLAPKVVDLGLKAVSTGVTLLTRVVNGLCGLIPEVGAAICAIVTGALRVLYDFLGSAILRTLIMKGINLAVKPLVKVVIDLVAQQIQNVITKKVDQKVGQNRTLGNWARVFAPIIDFITKVITQWAVPGAKDNAGFKRLVASLGDEAVLLASAKAPPTITPPVFKPPVLKPPGLPPGMRPGMQPPGMRPGLLRPGIQAPTQPGSPVLRPAAKLVLRPPAMPAMSPAQAKSRMLNLFRGLSRSRITGLRSAQALARHAAKAKSRGPALRALQKFRRAFQGAFRIVYSMRSRTRSALARLGAAVAARLGLAMQASAASKALAPITGPAAGPFNQATAALRMMVESGTRYLNGLGAVATGSMQKMLGSMKARFEKMAAQATTALAEAAKLLQ